MRTEQSTRGAAHHSEARLTGVGSPNVGSPRVGSLVVGLSGMDLGDVNLSGVDLPLVDLPLVHLARLTDHHGIFEHTSEHEPRLEHGYCLDDVARALEFTVREWSHQSSSPARSGKDAQAVAGPTTQAASTHAPAVPAPAPGTRDADVTDLTHTYLSFVEGAIAETGGAHNRMNTQGEWTDRPAGGDWWGRAVSALGITVAMAPDAAIQERAAVAFARAAPWNSADLRARLYAAVGAAEVLAANATSTASHTSATNATSAANAAQRLLTLPWDAIGADFSPSWPWPEPQLRYGNGIIPEALIAAGTATTQPELVSRGLRFLDFLLDVQTARGHLSLVGQDGWSHGQSRPQFDQQPIEAVTLALACARAFEVTGREHYREGVSLACRWFLGDNDSQTPMLDLATGAGYDGLTATGRNLNQGAESTLAALTTFQAARHCGIEPATP